MWLRGGRLANPTLRAALSLASLSAWLVLLFAGWTAGGAVHLLFAASLALFPWRALRSGGGDGLPGAAPGSEDETT